MASRIAYNNPKPNGALSLPYHYEMVSDSKRINPIAAAIQQSCKDKRVLESGAGSGILSLLAARAGATVVYAIEKDRTVFQFAKRNIQNSKFADRIKLLNKDTVHVRLKDIHDERVDVVIAENLSTWQVMEPQIPILNHVNRYLAQAAAIRIPGRIQNYLQLVHANFNFENLISLRTHYFEFSGIRKPSALSETFLFNTVDLKKINDLEIHKAVTVTATRSGILNALKLTSPLALYKNIRFTSSDSLMPPVIVPLESDIKIRKGNKIRITIRYTYNTSWENFKLSAKLL